MSKKSKEITLKINITVDVDDLKKLIYRLDDQSDIVPGWVGRCAENREIEKSEQ